MGEEVIVSAGDINALAQALDGGAVPAVDLLRPLVTALQGLVGDDEVVTVSVELEPAPSTFEPVGETFEEAFVAEPASEDAGHAGGQVIATYRKIGR